MGVLVRGVDGLWKKHFVAVGVSNGPHGLEVADPFGFVGAATAVGSDLAAMGDEILEFCKTLRIRGLQYRTDAVDVLLADFDKLARLGWDISEVADAVAA